MFGVPLKCQLFVLTYYMYNPQQHRTLEPSNLQTVLSRSADENRCFCLSNFNYVTLSDPA